MIPVGCSVGTSIYSIHHNPLYFPRPDEYLPKRWLSNEAELRTEKLGVISAASKTFSQGTHAYIGRLLAQLELQLALVSIM